MKQKLDDLFKTLPANVRALYYPLYLSVIKAIENADFEVVPYLLESPRPYFDNESQSEFIAKVKAVIEVN